MGLSSRTLCLQSLNVLAGEGSTSITSTPKGAKLKASNTHTTVLYDSCSLLCSQCVDAVPLTLYANGIVMFQGPFRPFTDPSTQVYIHIAQFTSSPITSEAPPTYSSVYKTSRMATSPQSYSHNIPTGFPFSSAIKERSPLFHGVPVRFSLVAAKNWVAKRDPLN